MRRMLVAVVVSEKKESQLAKRGIFDSQLVEYIPVRTASELRSIRADLVLSKIYPGMENQLLEALHAIPQEMHATGPVTQKIFSDRWEVIKKIWKGDRSFAPDSAIIHSVHDGMVDAFLREHEQVILKTRTACGHPDTHIMCVASSVKSVRDFVTRMRDHEIIIQQLVNHSGSFLKVFVIGSHISVHVRESIERNCMQDGVEFNSQNLPVSHGGDVPDNIRDEAVEIAEEIKKLFGTDLLGFDAVVDSDCGKIVIVDVNFFPSYKELGSEFQTRLDQFCLGRKPFLSSGTV